MAGNRSPRPLCSPSLAFHLRGPLGFYSWTPRALCWSKSEMGTKYSPCEQSRNWPIANLRGLCDLSITVRAMENDKLSSTSYFRWLKKNKKRVWSFAEAFTEFLTHFYLSVYTCHIKRCHHNRQREEKQTLLQKPFVYVKGWDGSMATSQMINGMNEKPSSKHTKNQ